MKSIPAISRALVLLLSLAAVMLGSACAARQSQDAQGSPYELGSDYVEAGYAIAEKLDANLRLPISKDQPIIVASFVNVNNLTESSTFGRMVAELVGSRLSQRGYHVVELKLRQNSLFVQEGKGEFMLSRDVKEISRMHNAAAVVVGTYAVVRSSVSGRSAPQEKIYVASRIVRADDSTVLSSCDYSLQNTPVVSPVAEW
ncbi:FlgO family outer membrane protein [Nitratidesulfovibrio sp. 1201_IL3209]|uniref:FlgO family outer membrane protein n=1 Tax=Nitratidesulfovibrio sp. 1201_IL3209 TaxID=3084053 RepID=UPI002FD9CCD6